MFVRPLLCSVFILFLIIDHINAQCFSDQNFTSIGEHTYVIPGAPNETYTIEIEAEGADGGDFIWSGNPQSDGGSGAFLSARFEVSGGDELLIIVGQSGFDAIGSPGGGGGGGGTAVIINNTDVLIAAAAGGGGGQAIEGQGGFANTNSTPEGGDGPGASGGGGFNEDGMDGLAGSGGGEGNVNGQGQGGLQGVVAGPGGSGFGGGGGGSGTGGGGAGGYKGGDGAATGSLNGKGGDSYVSTLYNAEILSNVDGQMGGGNNQNGSVLISCIPPAQLIVSIGAQEDPYCVGQNTGEVYVAVTGGMPPYMYSVNGGPVQSTGDFYGLTAGMYTFTVEDAEGMIETVSTTLVDPPPVGISVYEVIDNECFGEAEGSIEVVGNGGSGDEYLYSIDGGPLQQYGIFDNLAAGVYLLTAFDEGNCPASIEVTVGSNPEIELSITNIDFAACSSATNGSIAIEAMGGVGDFDYSADGVFFETDSIIDELGPDDYDVIVIDGAGCVAMIEATVGILDSFDFVLDTVFNATCDTFANGSILLNASGGLGSFTYSLDSGLYQMSALFDTLNAGLYQATAMDSAGCTQTIPVEIMQEAAFTIQSDIGQPTCINSSDGFIHLSLDSLGQPYSFVWSGNGVGINQQDQSGLQAGLYEVMVIDTFGCEVSTSFNLSPQHILNTDTIVTESVSCFNGSDGIGQITADGGTAPYMYQIEDELNTTGVFENLSPGHYEVIMVDVNGCTHADSMSIDEPPAMSLNIVEIQDATCENPTSGSVKLEAVNNQGIVSYTLETETNETGFFENIAAKTHTIFATDEQSCMASISATVGGIVAYDAMVTNPSCHSANGPLNGSININIQDGNASFLWTGPNTIEDAQSQENLGAGTYCVVMTDLDNDCDLSECFVLTEPEELTTELLASSYASDDSAADGTASFSANMLDVSFAIGNDSNQDGIFNELPAGVHTVVVSTQNGCTTSLDFEIFMDIQASFELQHITCFGDADGSISIDAWGGFGELMYSLNSGPNQSEPKFDDLESGEYTLIITDENNETANLTFTITEPDELVIESVETTYPSCFGDINGAASAYITGGTAPYYILSEEGDTLNLSVESDGFVQLLEDEAAGTYALECVDTNGCMTSVTIILEEPSEIVLDSLVTTNATCLEPNGGSIVAVASGGVGELRYSIDEVSSDGQFMDLASDNYLLVITDENQCSANYDITIALEGELEVSEIIASDPKCAQDSTGSINIELLDEYSGVTYSLDGEVNDDGKFEDLPAGTYIIEMMDSLACTQMVEVELMDPPALTIDVVGFNPDSGTMNGSITVEANGGTPDYSYSIDDGANYQMEATFDGLTNQTYTILVQDANACENEVVFDLIASSVHNQNLASFTIYPNPVTDVIHIEMDLVKTLQGHWKLYDNHGALIKQTKEKRYGNDTLTEMITVTHLPAGLYVLSFQSPKYLFSERVILIK